MCGCVGGGVSAGVQPESGFPPAAQTPSNRASHPGGPGPTRARRKAQRFCLHSLTLTDGAMMELTRDRGDSGARGDPAVRGEEGRTEWGDRGRPPMAGRTKQRVGVWVGILGGFNIFLYILYVFIYFIYFYIVLYIIYFKRGTPQGEGCRGNAGFEPVGSDHLPSKLHPCPTRTTPKKVRDILHMESNAAKTCVAGNVVKMRPIRRGLSPCAPGDSFTKNHT